MIRDKMILSLIILTLVAASPGYELCADEFCERRHVAEFLQNCVKLDQ